jgi:hypothetical protein
MAALGRFRRQMKTAQDSFRLAITLKPVIVRILGEGQLDVPASALDALNALDGALQDACSANDAEAFDYALGELLAKVREVGTVRPDEVVQPSELVLPSADASLAEVKELLSEEGLIPG